MALAHTVVLRLETRGCTRTQPVAWLVVWAGGTTLTGSKTETETETGWVFRPEGPILLAQIEGLGILAGFLLGVMADLLCQLLQELFHRGFVGHFRGVARDKELIR